MPGSGTWVRQVLAILAPPQQGYVKRCSCVVCGAPKKLPSVTAYVYCDYCASLIDYDLRRACEGDTTPGPAYAATVNSTQAASRAAAAAGDRDTYRDLQRKVYEAYAANVPMAVSHRARNDPAYRTAYVNFMAEFAVARAFDPTARALEAEMKQHVMGIRCRSSPKTASHGTAAAAAGSSPRCPAPRPWSATAAAAPWTWAAPRSRVPPAAPP